MIPFQVRDLYKNIPAKKKLPPELRELYSAVEDKTIKWPTVFVILDALDESGERVQDQISDRIKALPFPDVRFLCTSRPFSKFHSLFCESPKVEIRATDDDITKFVDGRIEESKLLSKLLKPDLTLRKDIAAKIIKKADGMYGNLGVVCCDTFAGHTLLCCRFLMAKLHMDMVATAASRTEIRKALEDLPSGIDDTYKETMTRIRKQSMSDKIRAERALLWVFAARWQLSLIGLQHGLAIMNLGSGAEAVTADDLPDEDAIISACQGLLVLEMQGDDMLPNIQLVHNTAKDYFSKAYATEFPEGHFEIAKACVSYLSLRQVSTVLYGYFMEVDYRIEEADTLASSKQPIGGFTQDTFWYTRDLLTDFPLCDYSSEYWSSHLLEGDLSRLDIFLQMYSGNTTSGGGKKCSQFVKPTTYMMDMYISWPLPHTMPSHRFSGSLSKRSMISIPLTRTAGRCFSALQKQGTRLQSSFFSNRRRLMSIRPMQKTATLLQVPQRAVPTRLLKPYCPRLLFKLKVAETSSMRGE